mmetsp:Transcript_52508/g.56994  ORF Transcript_52508/g.56994 Transcript_52508/m.56994 type:complete len:214 (+) Transcript_52508:85-726(+)
MKFSSNTTNALFSLLILSNIASTAADYISYLFTGGDCATSDNTMKIDSFFCTDSDRGATTIPGDYYIEVDGKTALGAAGGSYFKGLVELGSEYTVNGPFDSAGLTIKTYTNTQGGGELLQTSILNGLSENTFTQSDKFGAHQLTGWDVDGSETMGGFSKATDETNVDVDIISAGDADTGSVAAMDTESSTATTNTVTISAAVVVVVVSIITLI